MIDLNITKRKAVDGAVSGTLAGAISVAIVGFIKQAVDIDPQAEGHLSIGLTAVLTGLFISAERAMMNWLKHRDQ